MITRSRSSITRVMMAARRGGRGLSDTPEDVHTKFAGSEGTQLKKISQDGKSLNRKQKLSHFRTLLECESRGAESFEAAKLLLTHTHTVEAWQKKKIAAKEEEIGAY